MNFKLSTAALWSASFMLAACGGGGGDAPAGGGSTPPTPTAPPIVSTGDMFPSALDNRWVIKTDYPQASTYLRKISSATTADGAELITINNDGGANPSVAEIYKKTADAVWSINDKSTDALSRAMGNYQMLRLPLKTGDSFNAINRSGVASTVDFDLDGKPDTIDAKIDVTVEAKETLPTPFGNVDAWRVKTYGTMKVYLTGNGKSLTMNIAMLDWYAPGIGMVKRRSEVAAEGQSPIAINEDLQGYRTSHSSSNSTPPKLLNIQASPLSEGAIELTYDRDIYITPDCRSDIVYHNPLNSQPITKYFPNTAQIVYSDKTRLRNVLKLFPEFKSAGLYKMELPACLSDILGNRIEKESIEYTVGASQAPLLLSSSIKDREVVFNSPFEFSLSFNKTIDAKSSSLSASVSDPYYDSVSHPENFGETTKGIIEGSKVTFKFQQPIVYGRHYALKVKGVLTATGGATENFDFIIQTKSISGPFSTLTKVFGSDTHADLNSDGLLDAISGAGDLRTVAIYTLNKDRSYSAAEYLSGKALDPSVPEFSGEFIGTFDYNGDGKPDIVTENYTLMSNGDSYTVRKHPPIPSYDPNYNHPRTLADYDGDGIPDLIESLSFFGPPERASSYPNRIIIHKGVKNSEVVFNPNYKLLEIESDPARLSQGLWGKVRIKDYNRDGIPDFYSYGSLYFSISETRYTRYRDHIMAGTYDFDGDGVDELVIAPKQGGDYFYLKSNSPMSWTPPAQIVNSCPTRLEYSRGSIAISDFDRDGLIDLMFECGNSFNVALRKSNKPFDYAFRDDLFNGASLLTHVPLGGCEAIDLDADGYPDLACDSTIFWNEMHNIKFKSLKSQAFNMPSRRQEITGSNRFVLIQKSLNMVINSQRNK